MKDEIAVSVCCITYNHEKYIRQCLDGFLSQEVSFRYEIIIHDDASTDSTQEILREYQARYPDSIRLILETENQYSQGKPIAHGMYLDARGKYIAICEGDDYWNDPLKLQKQYDALEKFPQCHFAVHRVIEVSEPGEPTGRQFAPEQLHTGVLKQESFLELICKRYCFQTSCYFVLADDLQRYCRVRPEFSKKAKEGDEPMLLYFACCGDVYYLEDAMSSHRAFSQNSWSSRQKNISPMDMYWYIVRLRQMTESYDQFTEYRFHDVCQKRIDESLLGEFGILQGQKQYKMMLRPEYRKLRKKWSMKYWVLALWWAYCPWKSTNVGK